MNPNYYFTQIQYLSPAYEEAVQLRYSVLRKPLKLEFSTQQLEEEYDQFHFGVYDQNHLLWACLIFKIHDSQTLQMRQVAVDEFAQGQGIGTFMVHESEKWAKIMGFEKIILHARDIAKPFYEKLNYLADGPPFVELNIHHYNMFKNL
ncbi:MAG: GNAT family N-acetyltransferase [Saprospiraceae bacterium]|nr:GNAT family N-acetyltransferase [Saprospiraceae bacterium]